MSTLEKLETNADAGVPEGEPRVRGSEKFWEARRCRNTGHRGPQKWRNPWLG